MKMNFTFTGAKKIVFGSGSFDALVEYIKEIRGSRPLIVLDQNLAGAGFQ